jgi:hypothetical protein
MPRHQLTKEEMSRGGKNRAKQESFKEACRAGFQATLAKHPYYARHGLKEKMQSNSSKKEA